jgi:ribosomal protein S18 acetylase RimI-like enzyme
MTMHMPLIRDATAEDIACIRTIARAAYAKYVPRIGREPAPMAADYEAAVAACRVVVIAAAGTVRGYMVAWPEADAYFIDNLGVDPECQGQGLGRRLIEHAAGEANRLRLPALRLYTNVAMTENLAMYAHLGFVETHRAVEDGYHRVHLRYSLPQAAAPLRRLPRA